MACSLLLCPGVPPLDVASSQVSFTPAVQSVRAPAAPVGALVLKRCINLAFATCALCCLAPLFVVVAALIKLTSRGPVFFRQRRLGKHGRPFEMLKFRTMIVNAEELKPLPLR